MHSTSKVLWTAAPLPKSPSHAPGDQHSETPSFSELDADLLRSPVHAPASAAATTCIASPSSNRIPLGRPVVKSPNAPTPSRAGFSVMKQHEDLDFSAALSALQWAAATVACARTGYPKPSDIAAPPVIRKLQLQSASLAAATASVLGRDMRDGGVGAAAGDRRPRSVALSTSSKKNCA